MPAPRRGANTPSSAQRTTLRDNIDDSDTPSWNTSLAKLSLFLAALKRNDLLYHEVKDSLSLVLRGYIIDSKHKKTVMSWRHLKHVIDNPTERFTFEKPSDPESFRAEATTEASAKLALGIMPTFGSKADADEIKLATDNAREKERDLLSQFNVAPITLEDVDRNIGSFLQSCITNEVYARKLFEECKQSGRAMLVELHNRKAGVSDKSKKKLLRDLETFAENGLSAPTVEAF